MNELKLIMDKLESLSVPVYESFLRQQIIYGSLGLMLFLVSSVLLWGLILSIKKEKNKDYEDVLIWIAIVLIVSSVFGLSLVLNLINPSYYAIQSILGR